MADGKKIVAQNLRYWSKTLGINGAKIAAHVGKTPAAVSRWLSGKNPIDVADLGRIADLFDIPLMEFMRDDEDEAAHPLKPGLREDEAEKALKLLAARAGITVRIEPRKKH